MYQNGHLEIQINVGCGHDYSIPCQKSRSIEWRPTLNLLLQRLKLLCRCRQKIKSGLGPLGYLFVTLPAQHYGQFNNVPLVLPGPTPVLPTYTQNASPAERDREKIQWQAHKAENENIANMNKALITMFLQCIQPSFKRHLNNDLVVIANQNFWTVFDSFLQQYGKVGPLNVKANRQYMERKWTNDEPIERLFGQLNNANMESSLVSLSTMSIWSKRRSASC